MLANSPSASASTACLMRSAMAWVSEASMVVWLTTPTRRRSRTGSNPSVVRPSKRAQKASASVRPISIHCAKNSVSFSSLTTSAWPVSAACEKVARVSSCWGLPWMTTVKCLPPSWAERFHTFSTKGHVVLYFCTSTPRSRMRCSSSTVAPNAGTMTTSSAVSVSKDTSSLPRVSCRNCTPRLWRSALTSGL